MTNPWRTRCRMADLVHSHLSRQPDQRTLLLMPEPGWNRLLRLKRQLHLAESHQWDAARGKILRQLDRELDELQRQANRLRQTVAEEQAAFVARESDIVRDLAALQDEFPETELDVGAERIRVVTEPIDIEGLDFGQFRIELSLSEMLDGDPYRVVAVEPRRAGTNSGVTHPHVSDDRLCEGDGRQAIRHALRTGRLLDFFVLVRQILGTYNSGSAYVRIEDWDVPPCDDCGVSIDPEESYCCEGCHNSLCPDCISCCHRCDESNCSSCLTYCRDCDCGHCRHCSSSCSDCHDPICRGCLDENERCPQCADALAQEVEESLPEPEAGLEIQPDGVGQAALAAGCRTDGGGGICDLPER